MKKAMRDHLYAYGRIRSFVTTYASLSEGGKGEVEKEVLDRYCDVCQCFQQDSSPCEHYQLFMEGWQEGVAQAHQLVEQMNFDLVEEIGRAAGYTSRRPPRNDAFVYAERDGADAKLHGEALRRFVHGWRQTGGDRRRIKGV